MGFIDKVDAIITPALLKIEEKVEKVEDKAGDMLDKFEASDAGKKIISKVQRSKIQGIIEKANEPENAWKTEYAKGIGWTAVAAAQTLITGNAHTPSVKENSKKATKLFDNAKYMKEHNKSN